MLYTIVLYDTDVEYGSNFIHYVKSKYKNYNIHLFTSTEHLDEYLISNEVSLLLVANSHTNWKDEYKNVKKICILWDEIKEIKEGEKYPYILKYQSAKAIFEEILLLLPKNENLINESKEGKAKILCVYTSDYKKLGSIFTYHLACEYGRMKKVLFINLQMVQVLTKILNLKETDSLSHIIYFLKQNNPNIKQKLTDLIIRKENISMLYGISFGLDILDITEDDMNMWIYELGLWKEYELIIFNVDIITKGILALFQKSDEIVYLEGDEDMDCLETTMLKEQFVYVGLKELLDNIRVIRFPTEELSLFKMDCIDSNHNIRSYITNNVINQEFIN